MLSLGLMLARRISMRTTPLAIAILIVAIVAILVGRLGRLTWVLIVGFALLALAGLLTYLARR